MSNMLDEDLVSSITKSIVEEDDFEKAATLFLSIPLSQRRVYLAAIFEGLRDKVEEIFNVFRELLSVEEIYDTDYPPVDLTDRLSALADQLIASNRNIDLFVCS